MKFYDETQPLYLETDASRVRLSAALLQTGSGKSCPRDKAPDNSTLRPITFASKCLSNMEKRYSNIEREALGILHGLMKFHHHCFIRHVSIITDHKPLVAIFKKDVTMLSQRIQQILFRILQYRVRIIYKPGPGLFQAKPQRNKDAEIPGMQLNIDVIETMTNTQNEQLKTLKMELTWVAHYTKAWQQTMEMKLAKQARKWTMNKR